MWEGDKTRKGGRAARDTRGLESRLPPHRLLPLPLPPLSPSPPSPRTVPKQSAKLLRNLQAYALVATNVRITCSNTKGAKGIR